MSDELKFNDKSGRPVSAGDLIIYSVSYGRSPGLSYGKVIDLVKTKSMYARQKTKVKVHGVDKPYGNVRVNTKPGLLEYSERILLVDRNQVPEDILAKLDKLEPVYQPSCTCEAWYTAHARECPHFKEFLAP